MDIENFIWDKLYAFDDVAAMVAPCLLQTADEFESCTVAQWPEVQLHTSANIQPTH
jgi:hypothetical protein